MIEGFVNRITNSRALRGSFEIILLHGRRIISDRRFCNCDKSIRLVASLVLLTLGTAFSCRSRVKIFSDY